MHISLTAVLGVLFLVLAFVLTFLMFQFWGYPYDKEQRKSACPQWKMNIHRAVGYAYGIIYVIMMAMMVPRLWHYQVEFPPRTVAHIMLGFTIGVILILKISILRWFRHFEEWMPFLGVALLLCTVLLTGLSLPFVAREQVLASSDVTFSPGNRQRVAGLLAEAGLPEGTAIEPLVTVKGLEQGRRVLLEDCTFCHDFRTAISRPRTPEDWVRTAGRMADKPSLGPHITPDKVAHVAAYLVAITPELQESAKAKRVVEMDQARSMKAADEMMDEPPAAAAPTDSSAPTAPTAPAATPANPAPTGPGARPAPTVPTATPAPPPTPAARPALDLARAKKTFLRACSQCHDASDVDTSPPHSSRQARALIKRMVENGLEASRKDLDLIRFYLVETYVKKK